MPPVAGSSSRSRPPAGSVGARSGRSTPSRSAAVARASGTSPGAGGRNPVAAQKLFFRVRDEEVQGVLEALSGGLRDPRSKYQPDGQDLMFFAAARRHGLGGSEVIARRLSDIGVPCASVDRLGQTPLFFAAREGNRDCASFLVEKRCEVNHRDIYGQSPLFYSVRESRMETCRLLVELGASWTVKDNSKNTAIYYAKGDAATDLAQIFDERMTRDGAPPKAISAASLWQACEAGHPNPDGRKATQEKDVFARKAAQTKARQKRQRIDLLREAASGLEPWEISPEADSPLLEPQKADAEEVPLLEEAANCLGSQRMAKVQAMVTWTRNGTDGAAAVFTSGLRGQPPATVPAQEKILAQAGEYFVCAPAVADAWRLRELEREFVLDHFDVFADEPWHSQLGPSDWCQIVNVIECEEVARQAISSIIAGRTPRHCTLQCVYVPRAPTGGQEAPPPSIVGYVHVVNAGGHLDVSHLKVQRDHQRKGLGSLLIAGTVRWAESLRIEVRDLRLVVVIRNAPAISLYRTLGFENLSSVQRQEPGGGGTVKWQKMWRPFNRKMDSGAFAHFCEARAVTAASRQRGGFEDRNDPRVAAPFVGPAQT